MLYKNGKVITYGSNVHSDETNGNMSNGSYVVYLNGTTDYLELGAYLKSSGTANVSSANSLTYLSAVLVSGGSASGGGDYTPEDMEWVTPTTNNQLNTTYTNEYNAPLCISVSAFLSENPNYMELIVDGKRTALSGNNTTVV